MKAKKILSLLVAMVMVFSCVGITAMAETVNTLDELLNAIENGDGNITLGADIDLNENSYVAQIGDIKYTDLQKAIDEAVEDVTITLLNDVIVTEAAYGQNALNYAKAVDCTIDLNGYTISANTGNSVFRFNISEANATSDVTVTLKNGKVVSGADTWCAVMACGASEDVKAVFNLEDLTIENSKAYDFGVKAWENSVINAKNVTINATKQAGGFYAVGGEIVLDDCTVNQSGLYTAPYTSMAVAVASNGKLTVNSGSYTTTPTAAEEGNGQGSTHGSWCGGVMNSGGSLIINGGTFANGNYGDDSLATAARGLIVADTGAYLEINGGTFNALKGIVDIQNNLGDASKNPTGTITGGTFSADPTNNYVTIAEGYELVANENGTYGVEEEKTVTGLSGTGTAEDPYLINNLDELIWFRDTVNTSDRSNQYIGKYVKLTADIDLSDETWEPIGQNIVGDHTAFLGTFDGGGHTISNLCVESTQQNTGFFANTGSYNDTEKAVVKNIIFNNVDVSSTSSHVGGVIGNAGGNTYVENVKLTGYIYIAGSGGYVGGIVGHGYPKVSNCSVTAESGSYINCGYWSVGGIVGYGGEGGTKITDSFVKGLGEDGLTIWGAYGGAAAICGNPRTGVTAENVYAENVHITGANYASGYLMGNNGGTIINGGVTNVTLGEGIEAADAVATIGESVYFNFADAMTAAQDGDTVKLVRDAALTDTLIYNKTGNITIDGNGKTITLADGFTNTNDWAAAIVLGNTGAGDDVNRVYNYTIKNVVFDGVTGKSLIRAEGVTLTMDGCTVKNCNMTDGKGGLIRLESTTSNIVNTSFINNVSTSGYAIITQNYNSDNSESDMNIGNCVFSGNSVNAPGVVHVDTGDVAAIKNTEFIGNTVATNGNAAVAYMGWGNGQEVSGCTFERNTVTTSHATTKRFASAIFCDGCVVKDNAFINNTATRNGETISTVVAVGAYYGEANISANYWNNGSKPVDGADYTVEYTNQTVTNDSYYATRNEDGTLAGLVTIKKLPNAEVSVLEPITLEAGSYTMWPSGDDKIDRPLEIVMNFKANDTLEECLTGGYSQWLVDFNLTFTGLTTGSITADNCYLAGKYGDAGAYGDLGWVVIPADDMELEEGVSYPVVAAYDATLNYKDICNSVKDFTAAIHVDQAIIDANPNFKVELSLVMTNPNDASDKLVIGEPAVYTAEDLKNEVVVAAIGTKKYSSLADAIAAAEAGDIITLLDDIELENAIVIAKDKNITLDLAGYTVTYNSTTQGEAMITNKGTLTINDTVGTGVINYNYTGAADPNYGKGNYTISNAGTLTVNGGKITIANLSSHAKYPIDNNSTTGDAILVINGGHLYNYNTSAIRQFCNSTTYKNSVTINGGLVEGYSAIWVQNPGSKTVNGSLTITGGEIRTTAKAYVNGTSELKDVSSAIYCTIAGKVGAWDADSAVSITGGTFNENVYLATNAPETIAVDKTNATFNGKLELPEEEIDETVIFGTPFYMIDLPMVDNQYQVNLYSGIDSLNYKEVGFKVYDKNDNILGKSSTDTVYKSIKGSNMTIVASEFNMFRIFGVEVFFGTAWDNTEIYFRPYAIDMNGKEILGKKYPIADIYTK